MLSCKIINLNNFSGMLLAVDCFDGVLLVDAVITTYNAFTIDGRLVKDFFTSEEWEDTSVRPYSLSCWSDVRPICFSLIKGKKTPVNMKFILQLKPELAEKILCADAAGQEPFAYSAQNPVKGLVLSIRYDGTNMTCTTGVSLSSFLPNKTPDRLWDKAFLQFLDRAGIEYHI